MTLDSNQYVMHTLLRGGVDDAFYANIISELYAPTIARMVPASRLDEGVFLDKSVKSILKLTMPAEDDTALRPDIANSRTKELWEIKSGQMAIMLGSLPV